MPDDPGAFWGTAAPVIAVASALSTAMLIVVLRPMLARYALARPNARSSHVTPTPQGGGMAIVAVVVVATFVVWIFVPALAHGPSLAVVLGAAAFLGVVGAADDIVTLSALPRLLCQLVAAMAVIATIPIALRIAPWMPLGMERVLLVLGITWFVNLVNFMDGIDWITVAEVVPVCAGICVIGFVGEAPMLVAVMALAIGGATLGFAPFNRPVARLFLGDVGSLPIGLMIGWLLVVVAASGHLAAALLLPLYYLADATTTLVRRLANRERVWEAHRTHFYQRATSSGFTVLAVVTRIFALNSVLLALALITVLRPSTVTSSVSVAAGGLLVAGLMLWFSRGRR